MLQMPNTQCQMVTAKSPVPLYNRVVDSAATLLCETEQTRWPRSPNGDRVCQRRCVRYLATSYLIQDRNL
jgi:hypothetical protein